MRGAPRFVCVAYIAVDAEGLAADKPAVLNDVLFFPHGVRGGG